MGRWLCLAVLGAGVAAWAQTPAGAGESQKVELRNAQGKSVGEVELVQTPHGILLKGSLHDVPPGEHAFHVHEVGTCEPPFKTAGNHFNPSKKDHGVLAPNGPHAGDMPNLVVPANGKLKFQTLAPDLTLSPGPASVFDADGSALVLHAKPDDYKSQPSGDAGDRIACGVLGKG